jgi:hypothetical protein
MRFKTPYFFFVSSAVMYREYEEPRQLYSTPFLQTAWELRASSAAGDRCGLSLSSSNEYS